MIRQSLAIANCRVSSDEQLQNNSLKRQRESVLLAAEKLGVDIPKDGWWSGSVSSKQGNNLKRKDIKEMLDYCKNHSAVKYLIVDEPDRFMRSVDEAMYFEVEFKRLGVRVWYACDDDLNSDNLAAKLMKFMKYFVAEGSNEERQRKSINGQMQALKEGRYTFSPKPGYKRGYERGIQEVHPVRGPALKIILVRLSDRLVTPTQALIELNSSVFVKDHAPYKMDKFRKIATDPFYAGIVEIDKQVKVRNENGLHEPLITLEQHKQLLDIFNNKKKVQSGPKKNGNPKYAGNNITICDSCLDKKNGGRFVGFDHTNGKNENRIYESYRCRSCGKYMSKQKLHSGIEKQFKDNPIEKDSVQTFIEALGTVWKRREGQMEQESMRIKHKIASLRQSISNQVESATDPANTAIKAEILEAIERKKSEITELEDKLTELQATASDNYEHFLRYAYDFAENTGRKFLDESTSQENRLRCKQILFPTGFYVGKDKNVYTPEKSLLITLLPTKKDAVASDFSHLVQ